MLPTAKPDFPHRLNKDGTHDSICRVCLATVASVGNEDDLAHYEAMHVCNPMRLYQLRDLNSQRP